MKAWSQGQHDIATSSTAVRTLQAWEQLVVAVWRQALYQGADNSLAWPHQEIIDQIHELILEDHRISAKSVAEQLGISREWVGSIIHEDLDVLVACFLLGQAKDLSAPLYYLCCLSLKISFIPKHNFEVTFL
jgi:hypothetical protein